MELRQLRYLVALGQELSFTRAAERANVAQPALSRQIRTLERELGVVLVDRTSRRVRMTAAGRRLVEQAKLILDQVEDARAEIADVARLESGELRIGTTQTPGPLDIAALLHGFHSRYPGIDLAVQEELSLSVADRLRADEIELGFVSGIPEAARHGLELRPIAAEPLVVALAGEHPLASRREIDFEDLRGESFVLFPEGATIRTSFDQLTAAHGMSSHVAFVTTDTDRMRELVAIGLGVGLLPRSDATRPGYRHVAVRLRDARLTYTVYLAVRRGRRRSPAAAAMIALVESGFTTSGTV